MNAADIEQLAASASAWRSGHWWEREAARAFANGDFLIIPGRSDADIYLVRFWLSVALRRDRSDGGEAIESGDSLMLHYFARGDDDQSLHDHPWDFRTTILVGGYIEHLPPEDWQSTNVDAGPGPAWNENRVPRRAGDTLGHKATDLHCVGFVDHGTWTLVRTGPRVRDWGFHPPAERWQQYRAYLDARKAMA